MSAVGVDVPTLVDVVIAGETTDDLFWEATETLFVPVLDNRRPDGCEAGPGRSRVAARLSRVATHSDG